MDGLPQLGLYRRGTGLALIVAPALFLVDNLLHPKELERGNEARQLAEIAEHYTRWQAAHAIGFVAIVLFAAAVLGLAFLVRRRQPVLGLVAGAAALAGLIGLGSVIVLDGYTWAIVGEASAKPDVGVGAAAVVLHDVQQSDWSLLYYLVPVGFVLGLLALAVGAARQGAVPVWAAGLLALATLMTGTETMIVSNAYFVAGAVVLMGGGIAMAVPLLRMTDAEFAAGGPGG